MVILAHTNYQNSVADKTVVGELKKLDPSIEVRNLAELYPDFKIDVKAEQEALLRHDSIIFQFPVWWYNMPSILKKWFEDVFQYGFCYGSDFKLKGKNFIASFNSGSTEEDYKPLGKQHFRLNEFWKNMENTAYLCQMEWQDPIYFHGTLAFNDDMKKEVVEKAKKQANNVFQLIKKVENK